MFRFLPETDADSYAVEYLYDTCFAPGREALSSYRLRAGPGLRNLSMIVRDDYDAVVGAIRHWPVRIGEEGVAAILTGPVAVHPTRQGEGLGGQLIRETLAMAEAAGWSRAVLVGDEPYYRRFGFSRDAALGLTFPPPTNPDRLLARALRPGAMDGITGEVRAWGEAPVQPA